MRTTSEIANMHTFRFGQASNNTRFYFQCDVSALLDFCAATATATVAKQDRFVVNSFKRVAIYLNDHMHLVASNAPGKGVSGKKEEGKKPVAPRGKM